MNHYYGSCGASHLRTMATFSLQHPSSCSNRNPLNGSTTTLSSHRNASSTHAYTTAFAYNTRVVAPLGLVRLSIPRYHVLGAQWCGHKHPPKFARSTTTHTRLDSHCLERLSFPCATQYGFIVAVLLQ
jgi:hypothetical protein